ncbi:unnamed protein product [Ectocarpus sp. 4 AP-2014]
MFGLSSFSSRKRERAFQTNTSRDTHGRSNADELYEERYGVKDYRSFKPWMFPARVLLKAKRKATISIGILHVKVVEARGLMARDGMLGKSDPYVNLALTGRYLSTGQEWSERLRICDRTRTIKYSLNPVWNETFSLPVRRAGAILRVELWDWDRGSCDDSLGSVEVSIDKELRSQKTIDTWYVLDAPWDLNEGPSAVPDAHVSRLAELEAFSEMEEETQEEEEIAADTTAGGKGGSATTSSLRWTSVIGRKRATAEDRIDHDHGPREESPSCEACIEVRRKRFGEVRLQLRFEFNEFAETCSHLWPEEPPEPAEMTFSPNRVYYNAMLLRQLAQPYVGCMQGASAIVHWVHPWKSLAWSIALVVMLLHPCLLIVVINAALMRIAILGYLEHFAAQREYDEDDVDVEMGHAAKSAAKAKAKENISKKSLLPPIDAPEDRKMQAMYLTVRKTKKLPAVVEQIGRRTFARAGLSPQRQVETIGKALTKVRRRFHPLRATQCLSMVVALASHMLLQLWLYRTSRFHLYFLLICVGVFGYNFYSWRGRAFILAVQAARQSRQTRIALTSPTCADSTHTASVVGVDATPTTTFATAPFSEATPLRQHSSISSEAPPRDQGENQRKSTFRTEDITRVSSSGGTAIQSLSDTRYGSTAGTMAPEDDSDVRSHADDGCDEENVDQSAPVVPQKPRRLRHSRKQQKWSKGHSGSAYDDVVLAEDDNSDSGEVPGKSEKAGWRSRVSKWYRDK